MCKDCGCSSGSEEAVVSKVEINDRLGVSTTIQPVEKTHQHKIEINRGILSKNDRLAAQNRNYFQSKGLLTINLLSSHRR